MATVALNLAAMESRRQALQASIDAELSAAERNRLGQFATPPALALEIARCIDRHWLKQTEGIRFADPSLGSGSFFSAALAAFGPDRLESSIGIEIDQRFASPARDLWTTSGLSVLQGDFTRIVAGDSRPPAPSLILANPPYVRHHHLNRADKERLQRLAADLCGVRVNGLAGLYVYFLLLATAWLDQGGVAAWLIPSEFMDVNYGQALKEFLLKRVALHRIHRFDPQDVQFGDALVSSVVLFFRKEVPATDHEVEFSFGGTLESPAATEHVTTNALLAARKWTAFPANGHNDRRQLASHGPTLIDFFRIQRGIATGCNKFFILERAAAIDFGLPEQYLRPILPSPRHLKTTIIETDEGGYPVIERQLCVIDCDLSELLVRDRHPKLWKYLQTADALGIRDGYLVGKRLPWYKQEKRSPAPFLCTYMGRGAQDKQPFRFIWNRSNAIGTNLYLMLYPRSDLAAMLRKHPQRFAEIFALLSRVTGHEMRGEGRVYGGGLNKIEPSELGRISAAAFVESWPELAVAPRKVNALLFD